MLHRSYWFLLALGKAVDAVEVVEGATVRVLFNSRRPAANRSVSYHVSITVLLGTMPLRACVPFDWAVLFWCVRNGPKVDPLFIAPEDAGNPLYVFIFEPPSHRFLRFGTRTLDLRLPLEVRALDI